ncbi:MAG: MlaE family lipid ABC transporter permease subunit [Geobacteraceae bacterium]|nr:MlaE family lipid ABC transporter permease subunit [Geobacteraceae bacterium]
MILNKSIDDCQVSCTDNEGKDILLSISGSLSLPNLLSVKSRFQTIMSEKNPSRLTIDLARLIYVDSAGVLALLQLEQDAAKRSIPVSFANMSAEARNILDIIDRSTVFDTSTPIVKNELTPVEQVGEASLKVADDFTSITTFLGDLLLALCQAFLHPASIRWKDFFFYVKRAGVDGLPIVALLSFLLGLIIAFMSSLQLKQFGANVYVASLVGFGMVRELGPILTAIIFAGRSGSAFAAEIGTMKVNEEVDALVTMGFDPTRFLVLPKVLAAMLAVPILTLYADVFGILGGLLIGVMGFDLTAYSYLQQTVKSIDIFDVVTSLAKSVVFAVLIAGIGCQRGFRVRGGAESVGLYTTSAVVAGLFLIIIADSIFAIILYYVH